MRILRLHFFLIDFKGMEISYPYLFEAKPGQLWITFIKGRSGGGLRIKLNEEDLI